MFMLPLLALFQWIAKPTSFLSPFFPPREISSFWGTSIVNTPSGTQKVLPTPMGRKYSIESSPLSSFSMTLTYLLFFTAPLLTFSLHPFALSCSWEVLQDLGSNHLPILLTIFLSQVFCPNKRSPSFNFQKTLWDDCFLL